MNNKLSNSTHWRTMRNMVFTPLMTYEKIDVKNYDLFHVTCYSALGAEVQGSNVKCHTSNGYTPFVYDDVYDIYEVPKKSNSKSYNGVEGEFLTFAHDTTNDYWLMADLEYKIDKKTTLDTTYLTASVEYSPWGYYSISVEDYGHSGNFQKMKSGTKCTNGANGRKNQEYDPQGVRLKAYGFSRATLTSQLAGKSCNSPKKFFKGRKTSPKIS